MTLLWSPEARRDLEEIVHFIAEDNPRAALNLKGRLVEKARQLLIYPRQGKPTRGHPTRELVLVGYPYRIIYRIRPDGIDIVRVLHTARDLPSLLA